MRLAQDAQVARDRRAGDVEAIGERPRRELHTAQSAEQAAARLVAEREEDRIQLGWLARLRYVKHWLRIC